MSRMDRYQIDRWYRDLQFEMHQLFLHYGLPERALQVLLDEIDLTHRGWLDGRFDEEFIGGQDHHLLTYSEWVDEVMIKRDLLCPQHPETIVWKPKILSSVFESVGRVYYPPKSE